MFACLFLICLAIAAISLYVSIIDIARLFALLRLVIDLLKIPADGSAQLRLSSKSTH
jgi:hypothetical protein